jgi:hypothetical protein
MIHHFRKVRERIINYPLGIVEVTYRCTCGVVHVQRERGGLGLCSGGLGLGAAAVDAGLYLFRKAENKTTEEVKQYENSQYCERGE